VLCQKSKSSALLSSRSLSRAPLTRALEEVAEAVFAAGVVAPRMRWAAGDISGAAACVWAARPISAEVADLVSAALTSAALTLVEVGLISAVADRQYRALPRGPLFTVSARLRYIATGLATGLAGPRRTQVELAASAEIAMQQLSVQAETRRQDPPR